MHGWGGIRIQCLQCLALEACGEKKFGKKPWGKAWISGVPDTPVTSEGKILSRGFSSHLQLDLEIFQAKNTLNNAAYTIINITYILFLSFWWYLLAFMYLFSFLNFQKYSLSFLALYLSYCILFSQRGPQILQTSGPLTPILPSLWPVKVSIACWLDGDLDFSPKAATLYSPCPDPICIFLVQTPSIF